MKKKLIIVVLALFISSHAAITVFAFPGVPFDGSASARGIDVDLNLLTANVGISVVSESTDSSGASATPVQTNGVGDGLSVEVNTGILPGVNVELVNALTSKTYDGDITILEDGAMLLNIDAITSPLVTTGIISSSTWSQVTGLVGWSTSKGAVTNARVLGGIGTAPVVTAGSIENWTTTETTPAHLLNAGASSVLTDLDIAIPTGLFGVISLVSADVITSTANATSDGTLTNAAASADVEFLNLAIDGTPIPTPSVNDVYVITRGAIPVNVARVTIMPIMNTSTSATSSSAEAVSLFIEVLVGPLAGTDIYLAQSEVESSAEASPSGPTSITFQNGGSLQTAGTVTLPLITGFMAALTIMTAVILLKQQTRYSWSRVETTDNLSIHPKPN